MTTIVGLDWSSTQLDACLLSDGQAPSLRRQSLGKDTGKHKVELQDRLRRIPEALMHLTAFAPEPDWFVIENAYRNEALQRTLGALIASVPPESKVKILTPWEWRKALGCKKNTKQAGHDAVLRQIIAQREYDEHELDAAGIALAWARILNQQEP